jgi:hypothetical protein
VISLRILDAPGTNRTCDPLLRRQVLYPLSYEGDGRAGLVSADRTAT